MRFSRLLPPDFPRDEKTTAYRQTGRSLGLAYLYIGEAMTKPETWVLVKDHQSPSFERDRRVVLRTVCRLLDEGDLMFFEVSGSMNKIRYMPYTQEEKQKTTCKLCGK